MLLLLELGLGGGADLDHGDSAGELGEPLLELLLVPVGGRLLDLRLDLLDAALDGVLAAGTLDDGGVVLGDGHPPGAAELVERGGVQLQADLLADDGAVGEDGDVLQHGLAAVAEAGGLHGHGTEGSTQLVDDDRGERLTLHILGDDEEWLAHLDDLLEKGKDVGDGRDLAVGDQDVGLLEDRLHPLSVGHHVGGDVALVELHPLDQLQLRLQPLGLLDGDDAVLAHLLHRVGDGLADGRVGCGDRRHLGDLLALGDRDRLGLDGLDHGGDALVDASLQEDRVGAGADLAETGLDERLGEHRRGGGAVAGDVVGLGGDLLDQLGAHVLEGLLELDLLGDGHTVVGDRRRAELLVEDHVAALGAEGDPHCVGDGIDAALERRASVHVIDDLFSHEPPPPPARWAGLLERPG